MLEEKDKIITEQEFIDNSIGDGKVKPDNELKAWLVNYVGETRYTDSENEEVTVEQIVEVMAEEFPEFLMVVAEENWVRGYQQAYVDIEDGIKMIKQKLDSTDNKEHKE